MKIRLAGNRTAYSDAALCRHTRFHSSREDAAAYLEENTSLPRGECVAVVDEMRRRSENWGESDPLIQQAAARFRRRFVPNFG
jgi:hypothetical protein